MTSVQEIVTVVARVQALPYRWPSSPTAESARADACGSCASKHALLAEELCALGISSRPLFCVGRLVPALLADRNEFADAADLLEVHELLTVDLPETGPWRVDVTWDPPLVHAGLPGTLDWDGGSDMKTAIEDVQAWYAPDPVRLRHAKEALRHRLYSGDDCSRRDRTLEALSDSFAALRAASSP